MAYDKVKAHQVWHLALRFRTQAARLGIEDGITLEFPESQSALEDMEREIAETAQTLSRIEGILASNLDFMVAELEYASGAARRRMRKWQC